MAGFLDVLVSLRMSCPHGEAWSALDRGQCLGSVIRVNAPKLRLIPARRGSGCKHRPLRDNGLTMIRNLRLAIRQFRREKAFTFTVLVTLAVCVGANAAIFSVIHTVLLSPLPYPDADRLVTLMNSYPGAGSVRGSTGAADYFLRRGKVPAFEDLAQYQSWGHTVGVAGATARVRSMRVTPSFFPLLGVQPVIGRTFRDDEMDPGNEKVAVLSYDYWQEQFAGDPAILDRDLRVDGSPYPIVGVLPRGFRVPQNEQPRFYVPIPYPLADRGIDNWHSNDYEMLARLRPDVTVQQAKAENDAFNGSLIAEWPVPNGPQLLKDVGYEMLIVPAHEDLVRDVRPALYLLWGGVGFVLLIGCVNITNLILGRSYVRIRETATRLALGARRSRLARELVTQSLVLAGAGGLLGVVVGFACTRLLATFGAADLPRGTEITMDPTVLAFTLGLTVLAGLVFGAIPSLQLARADLRAVLNAESRGATGDRRTLWIRTSLVTAQVALAFVLLAGGGLMLASFRSAMSVEPGFQPDNVFTARIALPDARYANGQARFQFVDGLLGELRAEPGIRNIGFTTQVPFTGSNSSSVIFPEGYSPPPGESLLSPFQTWVAGDYFEAMGIPVLEGRSFEPADGDKSRRVIILDEWLAHRYFGSSDPIGKRMVWGSAPGQIDERNIYTIVGVVGSIRQNDLTMSSDDQVGAYYFPYRQNPGSFVSIVAKAAGDALALTSRVRDQVKQDDAELPVFDVATMRSRVDGSLSNRRSSMFLFLVFAGVALFLAVIGLYGVLAYAVAQRRREMGIRLALGSSTREIFVIVLRHGAKVTGFGLLAGAVAAALLGRLMRTLLYGVQPLDPVVLGFVAVLLGIVAMIACAVPALQATRLDPVRALTGD
jgi:putative ABC transport system permease protein